MTSSHAREDGCLGLGAHEIFVNTQASCLGDNRLCKEYLCIRVFRTIRLVPKIKSLRTNYPLKNEMALT